MSVNFFVKTFFALVITLALIAAFPKPPASPRAMQYGPTAVAESFLQMLGMGKISGGDSLSLLL
jgi:hypothetical protein